MRCQPLPLGVADHTALAAIAAALATPDLPPTDPPVSGSILVSAATGNVLPTVMSDGAALAAMDDHDAAACGAPALVDGDGIASKTADMTHATLRMEVDKRPGVGATVRDGGALRSSCGCARLGCDGVFSANNLR